MRFTAAPALLPALFIVLCPAMAGCVSLARTVVTAPVKIVSKSADLLTTSQSEADEKRGRALREQDEKRGALARLRDKSAARCRAGNDKACDDFAKYDAAIEEERGPGPR